MKKQLPKTYHHGYWSKRCKIKDNQGTIELAYQKQWENENTKSHCLNLGSTRLGLLLNNERLGNLRSKPTKRDYKVAATVIQWLGTNCGRAFLDDVQRRIRQLTKDTGK